LFLKNSAYGILIIEVMTNKNAKFINSMPSPGLEFSNFPFLQQRYDKGFFTRFVNEYFLFILETSKRLQCDPKDTFDEFLSMLYNADPKVLNTYSTPYLTNIIYGPARLKESHELQILDSKDKFFLAFKLAHLGRLEYASDYVDSEIYRLAGLLVIGKRMQIRVLKQPKLIEATKEGIKFSDKYIIKKASTIYKNDCESALALLERRVPLGRTYAPIAQEYFEFLNFFIKEYKEFTTTNLREVLSRWFLHYKAGKSDVHQKNDQESIPNYVMGPLYYLRGKPPGSGRTKK
jgi:hypothetical protein